MTNQENDQLSKICSNCGKPKALSDYLQYPTPQGVTYGSVCAECRKLIREKLSKSKYAKEDAGTSSTGHKIDTKSKVQFEKDKRKFHSIIEEMNEKERDIKELKAQDKLSKTDKNQKDERKHRDNFLKPPKTEEKPKAATENVHGSVEQITEAERVDYTAPFVDTQIAGKLKFTSGIAHKALMSLLGSGKTAATPTEKNAQNKAQDTAKQKEKPATKDESLTEYAKNTWGRKR